MNRFIHMIPAGVGAIVVTAIIFGCGGSGGGGTATSTTANSTTGTATTATSSSGTATTGTTTAGISFTTSPATSTISQQAQTCTVTLVDTTPGSATNTYIWAVESQRPGPAGVPILTTPGAQGSITTIDGKPFPTGPTSLKQAVYVGSPDDFKFAQSDYVRAYVPGNANLVALANISLDSDFTTLPKPVTSAVASMSIDKTTYKPGDTITAHYHVVPGLYNGGSANVDVIGLAPSRVTVNGSPATLPFNIKYKSTDGPIDVTATFMIPSNWTNEFPVSGANSGQTGSWIQMWSGAWFIAQPLFVHN